LIHRFTLKTIEALKATLATLALVILEDEMVIFFSALFLVLVFTLTELGSFFNTA
jgi:hypothetical protein